MGKAGPGGELLRSQENKLGNKDTYITSGEGLIKISTCLCLAILVISFFQGNLPPEF